MTAPDDAHVTASPTAEPWASIRGFVRRGGRIFGIVLLAFVGFLLIRGMTQPYAFLRMDPGFMVAIALVGGGLLLLRGQEPAAAGSAITKAPRQRSPLGVLTLSAGFCLCGVMILLGNLEIADVGIPQIAATGLLVVGLGLLVGAWWGRSRLLIAVGVVLVPVVVLTAFIQFPLRGAVGDRHLTILSLDELDEDYEVLVGTLTLDLSRVEDFSIDSEVTLDVAAGRVRVFVPQRVGLSVNGAIEWGNATIGDGREQGEDLRLSKEFAGTEGAGSLDINLRGGIASFYLERISYRELYGRTRAEERAEQRRDEREEERARAEAREKERRRDRAAQRRERRNKDA